jgi:TRAP-type C4-dicarboxylate transport system substrate-binding protein
MLTLLVATSPVAFGQTLKIAALSAEGSAWMKTMRAAAAEVKTATDGRVKIKFYPGGVMGDDKAVLRKMRVGQLHGAAVTTGVLTGAYTDVQLYNLPMLFQSLEEADYVRERIDPMIAAGLKEAGYSAMGFAGLGFAYAMAMQPATTVAGARKQKVWLPDGDPGAAYALQAFGITPIPLTIADVLAGLQTGLINAVAVPPVGAVALQWHTQLKYLLDLPLMYICGTTIVSEKALAKLAGADAAAVKLHISEAMRAIDAQNRKDAEATFNVLAKQGLSVLEPSVDEVAEWQSYADSATVKLLEKQVITQGGYDELMAHLESFRAGSGS